MKDSWKQVLSLVKKTGDRCIILDEASEDVFVVMGLHEYEKFVFGENTVCDLTEEELLDKINQDIAIWQANHEQEQEVNIHKNSEFKEADSVDNSQEDDRYYIEPIE
jgi:hypothetical protein